MILITKVTCWCATVALQQRIGELYTIKHGNATSKTWEAQIQNTAFWYTQLCYNNAWGRNQQKGQEQLDMPFCQTTESKSPTESTPLKYKWNQKNSDAQYQSLHDTNSIAVSKHESRSVFFSKLIYIFFGYFDPVNTFFDNKIT